MYRSKFGPFLGVFFCLLFGSMPGIAQEEIAKLFLSAPDSVLPHFSREDKSALLEQVTLAASGKSTDPVRNIYGGNSKILSLSKSRLVLQLDEASTVELKVLETSGRTTEAVIGVIYTDLTSPSISVLAFYDPRKHWSRIPTSELISLPSAGDFLRSPDMIDSVDVKKALVERGQWFFSATFGDEDETLTLLPTTFREKIARALHPTLADKLVEGILYRWQNKMFVKEGSLPNPKQQ